MKAALTALAGALGLAACVPSVRTPAPMPPPPPVARHAPAPSVPDTPPAVQIPAPDSWRDAPATPGTWRYSSSQSTIGRSSRAAFVTPGGGEAFSITCHFGDNIGLARTVRTNRNLQMTIRTATASATRLVPPDPEGGPFVNAVVRPSDPLLDAMALSKGRFAIEVEGLPTLYLPSWAEVSRVIEDCR